MIAAGAAAVALVITLKGKSSGKKRQERRETNRSGEDFPQSPVGRDAETAIAPPFEPIPPSIHPPPPPPPTPKKSSDGPPTPKLPFNTVYAVELAYYGTQTFEEE
ncbi:hypothetical protein BU24DRAFT_413581 [Aaosphaeria arxii CBS 175.79]|uniref:Uncharacterized protein n=1 Tax=Aaosphaeria arxii CBS 175.79 TaxID=1450172 RepID=A0A6A5XD91_9PLEO|nr:uncharacterized protein BU24DRAFT_413581 [Aaosphaeria arxii CBS 175.79]KAF2010871.1 hypothetical protein BU24DRAFT_413581 [Aaosphaeria arxii CBS 175.79]